MNEKDELELYVHIPFCERKCEYCDFLSFTSDEWERDAYINQLIAEIRAQGTLYKDKRLSTIYFGGGTPSILRGVDIFNIMSAIYESFAINAAAEISIECNPGTLTESKLSYYRDAGINRLSIGLQSADNDELKMLGRIHTYEKFLESYQLARYMGFDNINIDIMSALPMQNVETYKKTVRTVLMLKPEHLSAYSLLIEEGTPFGDMYGRAEARNLLPDDETDRHMYYITRDMAERSGLHQYEISNFARPGYECRHNIGYWTGAEYLGVGLGASSYVYGHRFHNIKSMKDYVAVDMKKDIRPLYQDVVKLSEKDMIEEFMFLGLRLTEGVSSREFSYRFGKNLFIMYEQAIAKNKILKTIEVEKPYVRLTQKGVDVSNKVLADFLL